MENKKQLVYLSALLHDIDAFYRKAYGNSNVPNAVADYFEKHQSAFGENLYDWKNSSHKEVIEKAASYACGTKEPKRISQPQPMRSIFESLSLKGDQKSYAYALPADVLKLDESAFPKKTSEITQPYQKLWDGFVAEFNAIAQTENTEVFAETLLHLLHKYTSSVPSDWEGLPDVSLYDHTKSVAAIAVCLWEYGEAENTFNEQHSGGDLLMVGGDISGIQAFIYDIVNTDAAKNLKGRSFYLQLLVDGIIARLLKSLKLFQGNIVYASGGGFYILAPNTATTMETILEQEQKISSALYKTHQTGLSIAMSCHGVNAESIFSNQLNKAWAGLAEELGKKKSRKFSSHIQTNFEDFFTPGELGGEQLVDAITGAEFTKEEQEKVNSLRKTLALKKKPEEEYQEKPKDEVVFLDKKSLERPVKKLTNLLIEMGSELKDAAYIVKSNTQVNWTDTKTYDLCGLGTYFYLLSNRHLTEFIDKAGGEQLSIIRLNDPDFFNPGLNKHYQGFNFYGGNKYPVYDKTFEENGETFRKGSMKSLDHLAIEKSASGPDENEEAKNRKKTPFKRIGVLRMDVDGLGSIFKTGLSSGKLTFSRYSVLSRQLDFFFKGYLNTLRQKQEGYKDNTYIIYSGGDDLFIVGKWDLAISFAKDIQRDFADWTCHVTELGLSGGVAIVPTKFPIAKGAGYSDEAEKAAKNHEIKLSADKSENQINVKKNAFTLLNYPLHWQHEFPIVKNLKNDLISFVKASSNRSVLMRIMSFYEQATAQQKNNHTQSWRWLLAYDFARFSQRLKKDDEEHRKFINGLKTSIFCNRYNGEPLKSNYSFLQLLALAARWAELEQRS